MNRPLRRVGIIGWPLEHSLSPLIHQYWMQEAGLQERHYEILPTPPDKIITRLGKLFEDGFIGCNITVPHKEKVFSFLFEHGELDTNAARLQSVNTVIIDGQGKMQGQNSDGFGFIANLDAHFQEWRNFDRVNRGPAVIIGAGGVARSILAVIVDSGMEPIFVVNRTKSRAKKLLQDFNVKDGEAFGTRPDELRAALKNARFLVNCTSLGMTGASNWKEGIDAEPSEFLSLVDPAAIVADVVYTPLQTELLVTASEFGLACVDGLGMLLYQAVPPFEAWFGIRPNVGNELRVLLEKALQP